MQYRKRRTTQNLRRSKQGKSLLAKNHLRQKVLLQEIANCTSVTKEKARRGK